MTYGSWKDIWLSEGWASYTEQLYVEHFLGAAAAQSYRTTVFNRVMSQPNGSVYVNDTSTTARIFDSRLTYDKGAAVAHMLRYLAPSDAAFFAGLKAYQQQFAHKTALTTDFKQVMETAYGRALDTFFNQWIYGEGYPTYTATWNQRGSSVFVKLEQTSSAPLSVAVFALPVVLKLTSPVGDTLVQVYLNSAGQLYSFHWNNTMTGVVIDPTNDIVNKATQVLHDDQLSVGYVQPKDLQVYPNPTNDAWQINSIPSGSSLTLRDSGGRVIWRRTDASGRQYIAARNFPPGIYTLFIENGKDGQFTQLLQKR